MGSSMQLYVRQQQQREIRMLLCDMGFKEVEALIVCAVPLSHTHDQQLWASVLAAEGIRIGACLVLGTRDVRIPV